MTTKLKETLTICEQIFKNCDIDYDELMGKDIDKDFFEDYQNTRIINSFLFNYSKLQDKIGAKLLKQLLYELKEIDNTSIPMINVLNILEKLEILEKTQWDNLRDIRNLLAHEYPFCIQERIENIKLTLESYEMLKNIYKRVKNAIKSI